MSFFVVPEIYPPSHDALCNPGLFGRRPPGMRRTSSLLPWAAGRRDVKCEPVAFYTRGSPWLRYVGLVSFARVTSISPMTPATPYPTFHSPTGPNGLKGFNPTKKVPKGGQSNAWKMHSRGKLFILRNQPCTRHQWSTVCHKFRLRTGVQY